ncbi:Hypothetical predicted protein [Podarcis lilfordi]|uniref:Uncharacterized protein n=1 Tax=Podarcis lilfordi TaxID=74358 RepID=A0AA35L394_9SAUR|nr:Hypothetical predicted protein [Podarcis lilfordi]
MPTRAEGVEQNSSKLQLNFFSCLTYLSPCWNLALCTMDKVPSLLWLVKMEGASCR